MEKPVLINGKMVGYISGDTYYTHRESVLHFYRKQQGYPISVTVLDHLKQYRIKHIIILETRKDKSLKKYRCFVSDFDHIMPFREDGFDSQKCIPLRRWEIL